MSLIVPSLLSNAYMWGIQSLLLSQTDEFCSSDGFLNSNLKLLNHAVFQTSESTENDITNTHTFNHLAVNTC